MRGERDKQTTPMPFEQSQKLARQGEDDHEKPAPAEGSAVKQAEGSAVKPAEPPAAEPVAEVAAPPAPDAASPGIALRALGCILVLALAFAIFATISWLARAV